MQPDEIYIKQGNVVGHKDNYQIMPNKQEVFRDFLKENLKDLLENYTHLPINNFLANWILNNQKEKLLNNPKYLKSLCMFIS